jgi:hypothetical protein
LNHARKTVLLATLLLASASMLKAQRFIATPGYGHGGYGWGGYGTGGWSGYGGWGYGFGVSGLSDYDLHHPEQHPPFGVGFAHGDPDFIPSTFMDYNQALALGKKILEEQAKPQPSLGEIARQLRARPRSYVPPPAPLSQVSPTKAPPTIIGRT